MDPKGSRAVHSQPSAQALLYQHLAWSQLTPGTSPVSAAEGAAQPGTLPCSALRDPASLAPAPVWEGRQGGQGRAGPHSLQGLPHFPKILLGLAWTTQPSAPKTPSWQDPDCAASRELVPSLAMAGTQLHCPIPASPDSLGAATSTCVLICSTLPSTGLMRLAFLRLASSFCNGFVKH